MTSTIKVNNIQNQCGANIINESSNTITIGASGDTVSLASGASQTGFGRTGTVDWNTTKKTASFTATGGDGFFIDTSGGEITATLPASPSAGDIVAFSDYTGTFATNALTLGRNSSNINGAASDLVIDKSDSSVQLIYVDATEGWRTVLTGSLTNLQATYITATGGTITTSGDFKIHTFTGPGTFCVSCAGDVAKVDYLVLAGGGGAGSDQGGGGGAGGYRESSGTCSGGYTVSPRGACVSALSVTAQAYPITVGAGGTGAELSNRNSANGANSVFSTITSAGGGRGGTLGQPTPAQNGSDGGSGGGAGGAIHTLPSASGGTGNTPPVSPAQGTDGGDTPGTSTYGASGGGAVGAGTNDNTGGTGATSSITGSPVGRAGGGGGRNTPTPAGIPFGAGGFSAPPSGPVMNGTDNKGGGGGSGGAGGPAPTNTAGNGGSGIVIIRYKYQ